MRPPSSAGEAQCKQGKACGRRHAEVHAGERGAHGILATIPRAGGWAFTNTKHKHGRVRAAEMPTHAAGGGAAAERSAQWCTVHVAPRRPLDGLWTALAASRKKRDKIGSCLPPKSLRISRGLCSVLHIQMSVQLLGRDCSSSLHPPLARVFVC